MSDIDSLTTGLYQKSIEKHSHIGIDDWNIKTLTETFLGKLKKTFDNGGITKEEYEKYIAEIKLLLNQQNIDASLLQKRYNEIEATIINESVDARKAGGEESFIVNIFKGALYKTVSIDKDLEKNSTMQNFLKGVIDELISLPEIIEILISNSKARSQFIDGIKNMTWEQIKQTFFEGVGDIASGDAYSTGKSAVFTILLLTGLGGLVKSGVSVGTKIAKTAIVKSGIKSIGKTAIKTSDDLMQGVGKTTTKIGDITRGTGKTTLNTINDISSTSKFFNLPATAIGFGASTRLANNIAFNSTTNLNPLSKYHTNSASNDLENKRNNEEGKNKFMTMDLETSALDILDETYNPTGPGDRKFLRLFKAIPLDKIFSAHNKATNYYNPNDVLDAYDNHISIISEIYIRQEFEKNKNNKGILQNSTEDRKKIIERAKQRTKILFYKIGEFLWKEKGGEFDNLEDNKKRYKKIGDLFENKKFDKFIKSEKSFLQADVNFNEFKNKQIKGLRKKLIDTQKVNILYPGLSYDVDYGDSVVTKNISYKGEKFPENKRGFYIAGYKYKLDGIKDITSIGIDGDKFIIKGNIYGIPNTEIALSKAGFIDGLSDLTFKGYHNVSSLDGKQKITIQRDIV